jgi:hypothetical protein
LESFGPSKRPWVSGDRPQGLPGEPVAELEVLRRDLLRREVVTGPVLLERRVTSQLLARDPEHDVRVIGLEVVGLGLGVRPVDAAAFGTAVDGLAAIAAFRVLQSLFAEVQVVDSRMSLVGVVCSPWLCSAPVTFPPGEHRGSTRWMRSGVTNQTELLTRWEIEQSAQSK